MCIRNENGEYRVHVAQRMKLYDAEDAMYRGDAKHRDAEVSSIV